MEWIVIVDTDSERASQLVSGEINFTKCFPRLGFVNEVGRRCAAELYMYLLYFSEQPKVMTLLR